MTKVNGAGTIAKRKDRNGKTYYRIRHSLGIDPITKKPQKSPWRGPYQTKAEAAAALVEYRNELEAGLRLDVNSITFAELADLFHEARVAKAIIQNHTVVKDHYLVKRLKGYLGDLSLLEIDAALIDSMYIKIRKEKGFSDNLLRSTHDKLKQIMKFAVKSKYLMRNPVDDVDAPKKPKPHQKGLTQDELTRFIENLSERAVDGYSMAVWIAMATGMRKSEILGLQWRRVNLTDAYIDVEQTLTEKGELKDNAKSEKSIRRIQIDPETVQRLKDWKVIQAEYFLSLGIAQDQNSPVTSNKLGGYLNQHHFSRWWREFCAATGFGAYYDDNGNEIPPTILNENGHPIDENGKCYTRGNVKPKINKHYEGLHTHELRHTYATRLIANGVDYKTVQSLMGHASAATTLNLYAHAEEGQKRAASDLMGTLLKVPQKTEKIVNL